MRECLLDWISIFSGSETVRQEGCEEQEEDVGWTTWALCVRGQGQRQLLGGRKKADSQEQLWFVSGKLHTLGDFLFFSPLGSRSCG